MNPEESVESRRSHEKWLRIRTEINKLDKQKTVLQCRNKICNLRDIYKNAKENNVKTESSPTFPQYFHHSEEVLGCRAAVNMPETIEAGQFAVMQMCLCLLPPDTNHCHQGKEDGLLCSKPSGK